MNRREMLQTGIAVLSAAGIDAEVATVTPRNPQAFIVTTKARLSTDARMILRDEWKRIFKGTDIENVPVLILQDGMTIQVVDAPEDSGKAGQ